MTADRRKQVLRILPDGSVWDDEAERMWLAQMNPPPRVRVERRSVWVLPSIEALDHLERLRTAGSGPAIPPARAGSAPVQLARAAFPPPS